MQEAKFIKLKEIAKLTVGYVGAMTKEYKNEGIPFLRSLNIKPFEINKNDMKYISSEFSNQISKSILRENDLVIVRTGTPGTCCVIDKQFDGCNCSDVVIVRPNKEKVDSHYLAAFVNIWGQNQVRNNKVGAVQQHFNVQSAEDMLIYLPSIKEQKKIAIVLVAINSKIKANNKINDNLAINLL